jgi:putative endopeptidase
MKSKVLLYAGVSLLVMACNSNRDSENKSTEIEPIVSHIDSSMSPGNDFFAFANNNWFKNNAIPNEESSNGIFQMVRDTVNKSILEILKNAAQSNSQAGSNNQKIGDLYFTGLDSVSIEKAGISPIQAEIDMINKITTIKEFNATLIELQKQDVNALFNFGVGRDEKNSSKYAVQFYQGGLGLPERDYYFSKDPAIETIRTKYKVLIKDFIQYIEKDEAKATKAASEVFELELQIAKGCRKLEELRDPYKNYNKMSVAAFSDLCSELDLKNNLQVMGLYNVDSVIVGQPEYYKNINSILKSAKIESLKSYLKYNLINNYAGYLTNEIRQTNFNFFETELSGTQKQKNRTKKVTEEVNSMLGELVGQEYVKNYLPQGTKEKLIEIGKNIMVVFEQHIKNLEWMSAETKVKALSKLSKVTMKLGYPDKWKDYSALNISRESYCKNIKEIMKWNYNFNIQKYGKPMDKTEWLMSPQTYNAYYEPTLNEICIPACNIIVPGYKGLPSDAILYAIIGGSTFGHEITHGFDDQGSQYSENGNLKNWWTKEDKTKFDEKTQALALQFDEYKVLDSLKVRGKATLGENIADLGGVVMGLEAFKNTSQGKSTEKQANGLTPMQEYFLGYAYAWMVQRTPAMARRQIMTDVHAPSKYRVIGPLVNIDEFYTSFNVTEKDFYFKPKDKRIKIW